MLGQLIMDSESVVYGFVSRLIMDCSQLIMDCSKLFMDSVNYSWTGSISMLWHGLRHRLKGFDSQAWPASGYSDGLACGST